MCNLSALMLDWVGAGSIRRHPAWHPPSMSSALVAIEPAEAEAEAEVEAEAEAEAEVEAVSRALALSREGGIRIVGRDQVRAEMAWIRS